MLKFVRIVLLALFILITSIWGILFCLVRPRHRNNTYVLGRFFFRATRLLGVKVEVRIPESVRQFNGSAVLIGNHQSNYDIFIIPGAIIPGVVSMGKRSLAWIPFFGQLYWLSGNILINREKKSSAASTIRQVVGYLKSKKSASVWMFPEGTRSRGRGLLPFKHGAFLTAVQAKVPTIAVICSDYYGQIDLNRWDNGRIVLEIQEPIWPDAPESATAKRLSQHCRTLIEQRLESLNAEIASMEAELTPADQDAL